MILNLDTCIRVLHAAVLFVATLHHFFIRTMSSATSARGKLNNFLMNLIKNKFNYIYQKFRKILQKSVKIRKFIYFKM